MTHTTDRRADSEFTREDRAICEVAESYLHSGIVLKDWWQYTDDNDSYRHRFEETLTFNRPEYSFGFFDEVRINHRLVPTMGNVQEMMYDTAKASPGRMSEAAAVLRDQLREFILHYFMRVADFRPPQVRTHSRTRREGLPGIFSWCPSHTITREGFGFSQRFFKLRETGKIGKFPKSEQHRIVDLREIGPVYDWIILNVQIFNFQFTLAPFGPSFPKVSLPLQESSYLVVSKDFIRDVPSPMPGVLGEYGFGYAFLKNPLARPVLAYGPGQFDAAFELIRFRAYADGEVRVRMTFVANRPTAIVNLGRGLCDSAVRLADLMSCGFFSTALAPAQDLVEDLSDGLELPDPVFTYIHLANGLTGGGAAEDFCISREQIDKIFLLQHFNEHYQAIAGSAVTWRQIPDWLDSAAIPEWVVTGTSA